MAKRGPKKKPLALIKLHGSNHVYNRKKKDLEVGHKLPEMPDWLTGEAKDEWNRVVSEFGPLGILARVDRAMLAGYCQLWADFVHARNAYFACSQSASKDSGKGLLVKTSNGNIIQNPIIGIKNRAFQLYCRAAAELGLTPSSRADMGSTIPKSRDKAQEFFSKVKA